jgi:hypothetical protein
MFADLGEEDLSLARLGEGHADAVAILAELGGPRPDRGSRWGVWAANPPGPNVTASRRNGTWRLRGVKHYCSGARTCTHALVTAVADDGPRLFAVAVDDLEPHYGTWAAIGIAGSDTLDVGFPDIAAEPAGPPDGYTSRPGFSHGGAGVTACWYGGARGVAAARAKGALGGPRVAGYRICYSHDVGEDEWEIYQTDEVAAWMEDLRRSDPQAAEKVEAASTYCRSTGRRWGDR